MLGIDDMIEVALAIAAFIFVMLLAIAILRMDDTDMLEISAMQEEDARRLFQPQVEAWECGRE